MQILKFIAYKLVKRCAKILYGFPVAAITILILISSLHLQAQTQPSREYQLKAAFLFNFTQFVEWPATSLPSDQSPLVIGILGKTPFNSYLEEIVSGEKINGHPIVVHYYDNIDEIKTCHILFVNQGESKNVEKTVTGLKGRHILTVSDVPEFTKQGGMIMFFKKENKIKLQINQEAYREANLVISSKLLRLAEIFVP